ncbi:MAG: acyltransferase [Paludibacter sp.]|nr:acyltransferase [Paludibacter sp.]
MIHPLSDVKSNHIGFNTNIWQFCVIFEEAVIGNNCNICANVLIENDVIIGNNVTVKSGVQIWNGVIIEDNVFIGPNVTFTNDITPRSKVHKKEYDKITIKKGASLGANSTIVAGVIIGEYAFIGAGSVVTKDILPYSLWFGNPAKHKGYITEEGIILDLNMKDKNGLLHKIVD